jgi:phosphoglycolate phosphatase
VSRHDLILFDLDGTLSDPLVGIGRSINHALAHFGYATLELHELAPYVGPPLDESFAMLTGVAEKAELAALVAKYRERYGEIGYSENVLYPGIAEAVEQLRSADMRLGLCTSKRQDFAERILEMFGLRAHFEFVSGGEIGTQKWQQIEALRASGRVSSASVMVGDRAIDVDAAHRNGLQAAGVLWGYGSAAELAEAQPRYSFASPEYLRELMAGPATIPPTASGETS